MTATSMTPQREDEAGALAIQPPKGWKFQYDKTRRTVIMVPEACALPPQPTGAREGHCSLPKCDCAQDMVNSLRPTGCKNWVAAQPTGDVEGLVERAENWIREAEYCGSAHDKDTAKLIRSLNSRIAAWAWQDISTAPKDGTFIWLSNGFQMRIGYWYVVTRDPSQEHWADLARAESGGPGDLMFKPKFWMPTPKPPALSTGAGEEKASKNHSAEVSKGDAEAL